MTPRTEAIAFRLWAFASPRGWDCTPLEAADALGEPWRSIAVAIRCKGWATRFRTTQHHSFDITAQAGMLGGGFDDEAWQ